MCYVSLQVVTGSLVLPVMAQLYLATAPDHQWIRVVDSPDDEDGVVVDVPIAKFMLEARTSAHEDLERIFFDDMDISKLEDYALATLLDPRFKKLDFPGLELYEGGFATRDKFLGWLRGAWNDPVKDWRREAQAATKAREHQVSLSPTCDHDCRSTYSPALSYF